MIKLLFILLPFIIFYNAVSQSDTSKSIIFSGYIEPYYAYSSSVPDNHELPAFLYSYNRHNEFTLNLGYIKAQFNKNSFRANFALMTGTYAEANLAAESGIMKNIFEANAGISLTSGHNLWVDAGIFQSHIGFESAIGKDCHTVTRSLVAENSPYYESGVKISYTTNDDTWFFSGLLLNGWQRIKRPAGNNMPAFGSQIQYKKNKLLLNSSTFIGSDSPDSSRRMRYFHNFYGQYRFSEKSGIILGFDIGFQQIKKESSEYEQWYAPVAIIYHSITDNLSITYRAEYYSDKNQVLIQTGKEAGTALYGYSASVDYKLLESVLWRNEIRGFSSSVPLFGADNSKSVIIGTSSMAVTF